MTTETEAREIETAINAFHDKDAQTEKTRINALTATALIWYNALGINIQQATTRRQALSNYTKIEALTLTETERFRLHILRTKLIEANDKYKAVKRLNP